MQRFFLFKRNNIYYLQFFDAVENRTRRISTKSTRKDEALRFLTSFKELQSKREVKFISLAQFCELYLSAIQFRVSNSYYRNVQIAFRQLSDSLGDVPLNRITQIELTKFFTSVFQRTKYGAAAYYRILRSAFNKAVELNYLAENFVRKIKLPSIAEKERQFLTKEEFERILPNEPSALLKDVYLFAFNSGMRINEILNCKTSWIDISQRLITIKNDETFNTKSKRIRVVPMNETLLQAVLRNFPQVHELGAEQYLFSKNLVKLNDSYVSHRFKKAARTTFGAKTEIHFHHLRGSFGSELIKRNTNILFVQKLLGHKSVKTTEQHYIHIRTELLRDAVNSL